MEKFTNELMPHFLNKKIYGKEELPDNFIESVKKKGILVPLTVKPDGTIISGHRRWQAAKTLNIKKVPVVVKSYSTDLDEQEAIIDFNKQREKTFSQRMKEAEELEIIERERAKERQAHGQTAPGKTVTEIFPEASKGETRDKVAEAIGIGSGRQYEKAKTIWNEAKLGNAKAEKLIEHLDKGRITVHSAHKKVTQKQEAHSLKPLTGQYEVILADPPWRYEFSETSMRAIENQYPTMELDQIKTLNIPAADNSVLFLWATAPKLDEAMQVLNSWGFSYKTCAVWDKEIIGMGYWFRNQHELLLVGVKGRFKTPEPGNRFSSVFCQRREKHSRKPKFVYEMLETMFPDVKRIELFARSTRDGWDSWGNEIE